MNSYQDYKNKALQNPEVKKEYDALQPEYEKALKDLKTSKNTKNLNECPKQDNFLLKKYTI